MPPGPQSVAQGEPSGRPARLRTEPVKRAHTRTCSSQGAERTRRTLSTLGPRPPRRARAVSLPFATRSPRRTYPPTSGSAGRDPARHRTAARQKPVAAVPRRPAPHRPHPRPGRFPGARHQSPPPVAGKLRLRTRHAVMMCRLDFPSRRGLAPAAAVPEMYWAAYRATHQVIHRPTDQRGECQWGSRCA